MWGNDDLVQVGLAHQTLEERVGVAGPRSCCQDCWVCDEAVAPVVDQAGLSLPAPLEGRRQCV